MIAIKKLLLNIMLPIVYLSAVFSLYCKSTIKAFLVLWYHRRIIFSSKIANKIYKKPAPLQKNLQKETGLFKKNHLDSSSLFLVFLQKRISPLAVRGSYTGNVIDAFQRTSAVFLCCLLRQTVP